MAYRMITRSVFLSLVSLVAVVSSAGQKCPGTANYTLSFYGLWKQDRHPGTALPNNAHFSPLVGCSHGSDYVMWRAGELASSGVELVAERGQTSTLVNEINARISEKKAWKLILPGGPQLGPQAMKTGIDVEVTANFSKVSIITMLAPSPDWFIGIDSLDLCDNGKWLESVNVTMLPPWDAGTEDGNQFTTANAASNPHVNIFEITNTMAGAFNDPNPIPSLGEFLFMGLHLPVVPQDSSSINPTATTSLPSMSQSIAMPTMVPQDSPSINATATTSLPSMSQSIAMPTMVPQDSTSINATATTSLPSMSQSIAMPTMVPQDSSSINATATTSLPSMSQSIAMPKMVPQDSSSINATATTSLPSMSQSIAMPTMSTTMDSSVDRASASFAVFVSAALMLAQLLF